MLFAHRKSTRPYIATAWLPRDPHMPLLASPMFSSTMLSPPESTMHDGSSCDSPTLSESRNENVPSGPRKPIPRKGHTKSRRGCFNCKRRRIKCNEKHPDCNHCVKAGLECQYPANIIQSTQRSPSCPSPQEVGNLRSTPGMFVSIPCAMCSKNEKLIDDSPWPICDYSTISSSQPTHISQWVLIRFGSR